MLFSMWFCKKEKRDGKTLYYCHHLDCHVDPYEPDCNI